MQTLRTLHRRWYIALPLAILTLLASFLVHRGVQPGYTVAANVLVLPPSAARVQTDTGVQILPVNPLLNFSGSTQIAAKALSILAAAPDFQSRVTDGQPLAAYTVTAPPREPVLQITVEAKDHELALTVGQRVIEELQAELERQQPDARPEQRLSLQTLAPPAVAAVDNARLRGLVVTLGVGSLITVGVTVLADGVLRSRTTRRHRRAPTTSGGTGTGNVETDRSSISDAGDPESKNVDRQADGRQPSRSAHQ